MTSRPSFATPLDGVAWVIGASSGLGRAVAQELLHAGWRVVVSARRTEPLDALVYAHQGQGVNALPLDVTDATAVERAVQHIVQTKGCIALTVVCSGQCQLEEDTQVPLEALEALWRVNVAGPQAVLNALYPRLVQQGQGQVVVVGSLVGHTPVPTSAAYTASKAALMHVVAGQHAGWWNQGLLLQLATPGFIDTPMIAHGRYPSLMVMSAEGAAKRLLKAARSHQFELTFPRRAALLTRLSCWLPWSWRLRGLTRALQWYDKQKVSDATSDR